ncbi:DUF1811 family protein [Calditerricola satsumensis]|uniref:DUF1811 family protein n=1 Tax=Calditerricola satsumensis TaxID=373054 RepID=UPI003570D5AA
MAFPNFTCSRRDGHGPTVQRPDAGRAAPGGGPPAARGGNQAQPGLMAEAEVLEQRLFLAKSYLCDPSAFRPGETYRVIGEDKPFAWPSSAA